MSSGVRRGPDGASVIPSLSPLVREMSAFSSEGYKKAWLNGKVVDLSGAPFIYKN